MLQHSLDLRYLGWLWGCRGLSAPLRGFPQHRGLPSPQISNFREYCALGTWVWGPQNIRLCLKGKGRQGVHGGCFHPIGTKQNWWLELENYPSTDYSGCSRLFPSPLSPQNLLLDERPSQKAGWAVDGHKEPPNAGAAGLWDTAGMGRDSGRFQGLFLFIRPRRQCKPCCSVFLLYK